MSLDNIPILRWLLVAYTTNPDQRAFLERAQNQSRDDIEVTVAVLDAAESQRFFGVHMARRGIQPVWLRIVNRSRSPYRLNLLGIDPNYYSAHEAAAANRISTGTHLLQFGLLAWLFLPLLLLLPLRLIGARRANRKMDAYFQQHAFRLRPVLPGGEAAGFVFTPLDAGNKIIHVRLLGLDNTKEFVFTVAVPGLQADYLRHDLEDRYSQDQLVQCDLPALRQRLAESPRATTNGKGAREGDPVNLVVVGEFPTLLSAFGARWDETETIRWAPVGKHFGRS